MLKTRFDAPQQPLDPAAAPAIGVADTAVIQRSVWARIGRLALLLVLVLAFLALAGYAVLKWIAWPTLERWQPQIEAAATKALGSKVTVGSLSPGFNGWFPTLEARDIRSEKGELVISQVEIELGLRALARGEIRFRHLLVSGVELNASIGEDGRWHLGGLTFDPANNEEMTDATRKKIAQVAQWAFAQNRLSLSAITLVVSDARDNSERRFGLSQVELANTGRRHQFEVSGNGFGTFKADWRHAVSASRAVSSDWRHWSGKMNWANPAAEPPVGGDGIAYLLSSSGFVSRTWPWLKHIASLQLVGLVEAKFAKANVSEVRFDGVQARVESLQTQLQNASLLVSRTASSGFEVDVTSLIAAGYGDLAGLQVATNGPSRLEVSATGQLVKGDVSLSSLDLAKARSALVFWTRQQGLIDLTPVAAAMGLESWHIQGQINQSKLKWDSANDSFFGEMDAQALSLVDAQRPDDRPGFENIGGKVQFSKMPGSPNIVGTIDLAGQQSALYLPGAISLSRIPLDNLKGKASWQWFRDVAANPDDAFTVKLESLSFSNRDTAGQASGTYRASRIAKHPGTIDLTANLSRATGVRVAAYLPIRIAEPVRHWVNNAIQSGSASDVKIRLRGDLWHFPFRDATKGEFRIAANIHNGQLNYSPYWPAIDDIEGDIVIDRTSIVVNGRKGDVDGVRLSNVKVEIADTKTGIVKFSGIGDGQAQDMLAFVNRSPLKRFLQDNPTEIVRTFLQSMTITGPAKLNLQLELPILDLTQTKVDGSVQMAAVQVASSNLPTFSDVTGSLGFSEAGVFLKDLAGTYAGGKISVDGQSGSTIPLELNVKGSITADALRGLSFLKPVKAWLTTLRGSTSFSTKVLHSSGKQALAVESDLVGMAIDMPAPIGKPAAIPWPMILATDDRSFQLLAPASQSQPDVKIALTTTDQWVGGVSITKDGLLAGQASSAKAPPPTLENGIHVHVDWPEFNYSKWQAWYDNEYLPNSPPASPAAIAAASRSSHAFTLLTDRLIIEGNQLNDVVLGGSLEGGEKLGRVAGNVVSDKANGYLSWNPARQELQVQLARLQLDEKPKTSAGGTPSWLIDSRKKGQRGQNKVPAQVPKVNIAIEQLTLGSYELGALTIAAEPTLTGSDLQIKELSLKNNLATVVGQGAWNSELDATTIEFDVQVPDTGKLLASLGQADVIKNGAADMKGNLRWAGSPVDFEYSSARGEMQLNVGKGEFLKTDTGIAKLFSLLNVQMLARRLALDFRDVFASGFAFDTVRGDIRLNAGIANLEDLRMVGPLAKVQIDGLVDLEKQVQQLHVKVRPEVNAGGASLAYAALANPAIGLGTFVVQLALRRPLQELFSSEYEVTGSFDAPKVTNKRAQLQAEPERLSRQ